MRKRLAILAALIVSLAAINSAWGDSQSEKIFNVSVKAPERNFGYFIGDTIAIEADISTAQNLVLDEKSLPRPGDKIAEGLELRDFEFQRLKGRDIIIYRLRYGYQIFSVSDGVKEWEIPEQPVKFRDGKSVLMIAIPAYRFKTSVLTAKDERVELILAPDRRPTRPDSFWFRIWTMAAAVSLASLAVFFLAIRFRRVIVLRKVSAFRPALKALKRAADEKEAFKIVHRAVNAYAGKAIFAGDLDEFFRQHRGFLDVEPELRKFYSDSERLFFAGEKLDEKDEIMLFWLKSILKRLVRIEKTERSPMLKLRQTKGGGSDDR